MNKPYLAFWHEREVTDAELAAIARSLQAWQLGETSEGRHLRAAATPSQTKRGQYTLVSLDL